MIVSYIWFHKSGFFYLANSPSSRDIRMDLLIPSSLWYLEFQHVNKVASKFFPGEQTPSKEQASSSETGQLPRAWQQHEAHGVYQDVTSLGSIEKNKSRPRLLDLHTPRE
jgi:hypothetical protein